MKVISYCLYGTNDKYYEGLIRNIKTIDTKLPDYNILLFVPKHYKFLEKYRETINYYFDEGLIDILHPSIDCTGAYLMFHRFLPASMRSIDIMHSRDLDSPILDREIACMREFENSNKNMLIIRDHPYHTARILGGLWGAKFGAVMNMVDLVKNYMTTYKEEWYSDQRFLEQHVYSNVIKNALVYDAFNLYADEKDIVQPFPTERIGDEFCGMIMEANGSRVDLHHSILMEQLKKQKI